MERHIVITTYTPTNDDKTVETSLDNAFPAITLFDASEKDKEIPKKSSAKKRGKSRADYLPDAIRVIKHLNEWAGRKFPVEQGHRGAEVNQDYVIGLLKKKYTADELISMIDFKIFEWKGTPSEKYLQPSTLLSGGKKCIGYIQASIEAQDNPKYVEAIKRARDKEDGKGSGGTIIGDKTRAAAERLANW